MLFQNIVLEMQANKQNVSSAQSFQKYVSTNNLKANTAASISIDSIKKLPKTLRDCNTMVLRLGSRLGDNQTYFSLVKSNDVNDFFFNDQALFGQLQPELFLPNVSIRSLFAFQLLPKVTETSVVNLAIASGLMAEALNLKDDKTIVVPATGQSTFTFNFKPLANEDVALEHINGQVEIDAVFVAKRDGKEHLFVIEAKHGDKFDSLAKHKLLYPSLSLLQKLPSSMPIVPVYLRSIKTENGINFYIAECPCIVNQQDELYSLDTLSPCKVQALHLANY
ncbi:hypothetical protein I6F66_04985 [Pseudoalteromonas sp. NZS100_1]|uniref:DUF6997 domain-containing protein n=1 Tax=Pseudoalteromonas sp. NZS100_1 TaxID=2792073 RepID=UPI0018CEFEB4|nr:hypothetical protein [Pseudoalteromonas sp. NZS100_1]MBH0011430.1 hypothetical protein [Pseudoalteromonas sp. NZS100_1]